MFGVVFAVHGFEQVDQFEHDSLTSYLEALACDQVTASKRQKARRRLDELPASAPFGIRCRIARDHKPRIPWPKTGRVALGCRRCRRIESLQS
jgi:hypothetical protein